MHKTDDASTQPQGAGATADLQDDSEGEAKDNYVTAFGRGLAVIRAFSAAHPALTIAEVARATGLNRATARRILHTLAADGYVSDDKGRYSLRPRVLDLGYGSLSPMSVNDILQFHLAEVAEQLQETCSTGTLDGPDVLIVARAESSHARLMTVSFSVGSRIPAYFSAIGRVLLAELSNDELEAFLRTVKLHPQTPRTITRKDDLRKEIGKVRTQGYSIIDQEIEMGVLAAAVPIRIEGRPTLGMSVALQTLRESLRSIERDYVPALQQAADELRHVLRLRN